MIYLEDISLKQYVRYFLYTKLRANAEFFLFTLPNMEAFRKTKNLKDSKIGRQAFVFANGPSISKLDPQKIKRYKNEGFDIFAGNSYIRTDFSDTVQADYYFLSDPVHFGVYKNKILSQEEIEEANYEIEAITSRNIPLFIPHRYYNKLQYNNKYIFNDSFDVFGKNVRDITKRSAYSATTLYKALGLACYMGYEKIYICGFDNNYFKNLTVDEDNEVYLDGGHFYQEEKTKNRVYWLKGGIASNLIQFHLLFLGLNKFKSEPIINLDKEGLVDSFSKKHNLDVYK